MASLFDQIFNTYIPGYDANPFDLSDVPVLNAGVWTNCTCTPNTIPQTPLSACAHPINRRAFLFRSLPLPYLSPMDLAAGKCRRLPMAGARNGISYHMFEDSSLEKDTGAAVINSKADHTRASLRDFDEKKFFLRGYEHIYGDYPGYSKGRIVTTESGMIALGMLKADDVYKTSQLKVKTVGDYIKLEGCEGKYLKELRFSYTPPSAATKNGICDCDYRFYLVFRINLNDYTGSSSSSGCGQESYRIQRFLAQESVIDNVVIRPDEINDDGTGTIVIDTRWATADFIEIRGYQPKDLEVEAVYMEPDNFYKYAVATDSFSAQFDKYGRLFLFYADKINYTELPHIGYNCLCPSSTSTSTSSTSGGGGGGGTPGGGGGGGGTGGGGGGGNIGIPGGGPGSINYPGGGGGGATSSSSSSSTSSSSAPPTSSSSSSATVPSKPCMGRDCIGCQSTGMKSHNSFTIRFSDFTNEALSWTCESCDDGESFIRILDDDLSGAFCLLARCDDADISKKCTWENTFFVSALAKNCKNVTCGKQFEKILVAMVVRLSQTTTGWTLEAYALSPDCKRIPLFYGTIDEPCFTPVRFVNQRRSTTSLDATPSKALCALCPPNEIKQYTGTISALMTPDMGITWYDFKGIIPINDENMAVRPTAIYDEKAEQFHLFYVLRDYYDENLVTNGGPAIGYNGQLLHVIINPDYFLLDDAFKTLYPLPTSSSSSTNVFEDRLSVFTQEGQFIRRVTPDVVVEDDVYLVNEDESAYIDAQGRVALIRFLRSGTYVDALPKLTRLRRKKADCGTYTWTVSGITDQDCGCQSLSGIFELDKTTKGTYVHARWTLAPSADGQFWEMTADEHDGEGSGMLIFHKRRNATSCPPTGIYTATCNRCAGNIIGTLDVSQDLLVTWERGVVQDSTSDTNILFIGNDITRFTVCNPSADVVNLTGEPTIKIVSNPPDAFLVRQDGDQPILTSLDSGECFSFLVIPNAHNTQTTVGTVTIDHDGLDAPYIFHISNQTVNSGSSSTSTASGQIYPADSVGWVMTSRDNGFSWDSVEGIKAGERASALYDSSADQLFVFYVTGENLFVRRYPSFMYSALADPTQPSLDPEDTSGVHVDPTLVLPNADIFINGVPASINEFLSMPTFFDLPILTEPGIDIPAESDNKSIKVDLTNEKDPKGIPMFLMGSKDGDFINADFPYPADWTFNSNLAVGASRPAAYVAANGRIRFFYIDSNGNVNGGTLNTGFPLPDTKVVPNIS